MPPPVQESQSAACCVIVVFAILLLSCPIDASSTIHAGLNFTVFIIHVFVSADTHGFRVDGIVAQRPRSDESILNQQTDVSGSSCLHLAVNTFSEVWLIEARSKHTDGGDDDGRDFLVRSWPDGSGGPPASRLIGTPLGL